MSVKSIVFACAVALILAGCGTTTGGPSGEPAQAEQAEQAEQQPQPATTTQAPSHPKVAEIGEWYAYDDGLRIGITNARMVTQGQWDMDPGEPALVLTVKVDNGTDRIADLDLAYLTVRYGPDGTTATETYTEKAGEILSGRLAPGQEASGDYVFEVPKKHADELQVEVSVESLITDPNDPNYFREPALFAGGVS